MDRDRIVIDVDATAELVAWASVRVAEPFDTDHPPLDMVRRLGAHPADGVVRFGFWVPDGLAQAAVGVELELLDPPAGLDLSSPEQTIEMTRTIVPMSRTSEFAWAAVSGVRVGDRDEVGTLYRVLVRLPEDRTVTIDDPLALSTPLGAFAPAEVVDPESITEDRSDVEYYEALGGDGGIPRIPACVNLLQVHVPTATEEGTLAALTSWISDVAAKVESGEPLAPGDELWLEYDGIELMPV
jgi:hypothetical protein